MFSAFAKGVGQLSDPAIRRVVLIALAVAVVVALGLWGTAGFLLTGTSLFSIGWLETAIDALGAVATLVLTWLFFPGVISAVIGFLLDDVAKAVENKHYPDLPAPRHIPLGETIAGTARFLGVMLLLNFFLLFFLFTGPLFPFVFYGVNGYLISREYFELVASRRLDPAEAKALRKSHRWTVFVAGIAVAFLLTVPVVNLLAPIIGTAALVHLFHGWRGSQAA